MNKDRANAIVDWAARAQDLSPDALDLNEPAESVMKAMDLAGQTAVSANLPFETEPSSFAKMLHDLAPKPTGQRKND